MSFWNLAHGRPSELIPPHDSSTAVPQVAGVAGAALATAGMVLTALYRPHELVRTAQLVRFGYQSLKSGDSEAEKRLLENDQKAVRRRELGSSYLEKQALRDPSSANLCRVARARFANGKPRGALDAVRQALKHEPHHDEARLLCIFYLLRLKDVNAADAMIRDGIPTKGESILYHAIIDTLQASGRYEFTEELLHAAVASDAADFRSWEELGHILEQRGDINASVAAYERANLLSPEVILPWKAALEHGKQAFAQGRFTDAARLYGKAARFKPIWSELTLARALLAVRLNDPHLALSYLQEILLQDDRHAQALFLSGNIHHQLGEIQKADEFWAKSFVIDESMPVPWRVLYDNARELQKRGNLTEALALFEEAHCRYSLWDDPREAAETVRVLLAAEALERDGEQAFREGDEELALRRWLKALELNSENASVLMSLGALYADIGQISAALSYFERALHLGHPHALLTTKVCRAYISFVPEIGPEGVRL